MKKIFSILMGVMLATFSAAPLGGEASEVQNCKNNAAAAITSSFSTPGTQEFFILSNDGVVETGFNQELDMESSSDSSDEISDTISLVDASSTDSNEEETIGDSNSENSNKESEQLVSSTNVVDTTTTASEFSSDASSSEIQSSSNSESSESAISSSQSESLSNTNTSDSGFGGSLWVITLVAFGVGILMMTGKKEEDI